jgi:phosphoribosyl-AMP cyclohydrolase / phosphoribosyl-ATP pyrophosphohydrolase
MIIPSIDLMGGNAVQLVGGKELEIDAGDPRPLADKFGRVGEIAVIDLDAALGQGSNADVIEELVGRAPCRVGGGIRDVETARRWLNAGARKVILGTAARPEILSQLPRERVIAALDAVHGEVVVDGWRTKTGATVEDRMRELAPYCGGFLVTFVEREGRMTGIDLDAVKRLVDVSGGCDLTVAGGVARAPEIGEIDRVGADVQVGMALYRGELDLADALCATLRSDRPDGLWPTVVTDAQGIALGLVYSNEQSLRQAIETGRGVYWSRSRNSLWVKGESSGATQELVDIRLDCDRDALRFRVRQAGTGFCHLDTRGCWGPDSGISDLARTLAARVAAAPEGSYTRKLLDDPGLLASKLAEEAGELAEAVEPDDVAWETADVLYFALVALARSGGTLEDVERHLDRRSLKVTRRN